MLFIQYVFGITAQQAKWTPDQGAYIIFNGSLEADFLSQMLGQHIGKTHSGMWLISVEEGHLCVFKGSVKCFDDIYIYKINV